MKPTVVILGAGLTGLTAAYRLALSGRHHVVVLEKQAEVGGLAGGFSLGGVPLEKAYHHIFRTDTDVIALARELGLGDDLEWLPSSIAVRFGGVDHPFSSPADLLRFRPLSFFNRLRLGLTVLALQKDRRWRRLEAQTARSWMRRVSGASACAVIWDPLLRGKFSTYADSVSMAWLWARIHIRANSRSNDGERLGYFRSGFAALSQRLREAIVAAGGEVLCNTTADTLVKEGQAWQVRAGARAWTATQVAFTGSSSAFARFLATQGLGSPAYHDQLRAIPYLNAACLIFTTPQSLAQAYWTNVNEPDSPFLVLIQHTRLVPAARYGGQEVYYVGAYLRSDDPQWALSDEALRSQWLEYLRRLYPQFDPGQISSQHLFRFSEAQHVVQPGYGDRIPSVDTPIPGLFLANFSQIYPEDRGTNYAVREGERLAQRLAALSS